MILNKSNSNSNSNGLSIFLLLSSFLLFVSIIEVRSQNDNRGIYLDRFTYQNEDISRVEEGQTFIDYSPQNWDDIKCNEGSKLDECVGYIDKWTTGRDWGITKNDCRWCPASKDGSGSNNNCGVHHQSPVNLQREVGYDFNTSSPYYSEIANECIDIHWMKYEDSFCTLDQLEDADAFTIERHALRIAQPISVYDNFEDDKDGVQDGVRLNCRIDGKGSRFGRIDYSKGFSHWWHLSHIDIHTPSEHTQDGKRYDGEIQLQHFYSITADEAGVNNEMGTVSVFLQAYDDAPPYRYLDKVICQWRRKEYDVRKKCGLDPVPSTYPGCFPLKRKKRKKRNLRNHEDMATADDANNDAASTPSNVTKLMNDNKPKRHPKGFRTVHDVLLYNDQHRNNPNHSDVKIHMEEGNFGPADETMDWYSFVAEQSKKMRDEENLYQKMITMEMENDADEELVHERYLRELISYDELKWFNYWPMLGARTEYYFRYSGSQTIPPCYGEFDGGSRKGTNHWRVLKDPIRIHRRQLAELHRLIAERIGPDDDPVNSSRCKPDTAAKVKRDPVNSNKFVEVDVARPLQSWERAHYKTFCECKDWVSKWPEDRNWCTIESMQERFYKKPYNYDVS